MSGTDYDKLFQLTIDIAAAKEAAEKALVGCGDGGSCNRDEAFISMRPSTKRFAAIVAGGMRPDQRRGGYALSIECGGQGARVTKAAETIADTLRQRGWAAHVQYFTD